MQEIARRYAEGTPAGFRRKSTLDRDLRPGELDLAVARAKQEDPSAIAYLYLRFRDNVYGYARSIVQDDHEAEDVTQQVFLRMIGAIQGYEPRAPFSSWLLRITHNLALDHVRRHRAVPSEEPLVDVPNNDEARADLCLALREALAEIPAGQREVVLLRHVHGWSPGEIARTLGRTELAVHGLHHRGRRALKAALVRRELAPNA